MDLTEEGRFAYVRDQMFCADTAFMMSGESMGYLCAMLNSHLITWFMRNTALTSGMGVTRWKKFAVERLPIPHISAAKQRPFIRLIDHILTAKSINQKADVSATEAEIDLRVYELYSLTSKEIISIEEESRVNSA